MAELKIVATITVKSDNKEEVLVALQNVVNATRKEEGNVSYDLHQNITNPLEYTILEVWKSQEAIDLHNASTHFDEFKKAIGGKIEGLKVDIIKQIY
ncbi:quinol monooxygenase YgiN [Dysgonomonas alginatilytica]|uniref:Quinol monooxygenase YgiN n=1 Tax=Dysgonomonas alginatilytica TaxID=1605892 RepID=A0A2V3PMF7_9BACT|nr:putative quinol monooxygenase [Dysgonomonas alginatilytica]PXV63127.1 quinol monooxygenase YgiN [Dysgonomonas alginatilytica]